MSFPHMEQALLPFFVEPQYLRVRVWSGPVDCQRSSLAFFCLFQAWGGSIIEKSVVPFPFSSKSFAYIVCSHTNHQLSSLAVFVLEDCMAVAVSCLIQIATVKESRNFGFNLHITLIHLLCDCLTENQWLQSLPMDQHLWLNYLRNAHTDTTSQNNLAEVKHWITMLSLE